MRLNHMYMTHCLFAEILLQPYQQHITRQPLLVHFYQQRRFTGGPLQPEDALSYFAEGQAFPTDYVAAAAEGVTRWWIFSGGANGRESGRRSTLWVGTAGETSDSPRLCHCAAGRPGRKTFSVAQRHPQLGRPSEPATAQKVL